MLSTYVSLSRGQSKRSTLGLDIHDLISLWRTFLVMTTPMIKNDKLWLWMTNYDYQWQIMIISDKYTSAHIYHIHHVFIM
jgi:hypothetical protein